MSDHPSTFDGATTNSDEDAWDDGAAIHEADDGQGVLDSAKALRRGSFAEMIRYITRLPEDERSKYVIQKSGDRQYTAAEAEGLAARPDFPKD